MEAEIKVMDIFKKSRFRSGHGPNGLLLQYNETTESIKQFLIDKCRAYAPDISVELLTRYSEKKTRNPWEPHRSYAYFILAITANEALTAESDDMYLQIGTEGRDNLSFIPDIKYHIINKYRWDNDDLKHILGSYKEQELLEESLGLSANFIKEIQRFSNPVIIKSNNVAWVEIAIRAEKVLNDMFTDKASKEVYPYRIMDIHPISENNVQYDILVDPNAKKAFAPDSSISQVILNSIKNK
jgi:hypothetical protein